MTRTLLQRTVATAACALLLIGQAAAAEIPPVPPASAPLGRDHALLGTIVRANSGERLTAPQFARIAADHAFVLLGEKHDNPDHHRLQAWTIDALVALDRKPAIAMEMLDDDQLAALTEYRSRPDADPAGLGAALNWQARGWPSWQTYAPIAASAFRAGLPILPGNLTRAETRTIGRTGLDALEPALRSRLESSPRLDSARKTSLTEELRASHCGQLPGSALPRMADLQWARDAQMATTLREAVRGTGSATAILIAGSGHVRTDRGVPWHLRETAPSQKALAVAFVEVAEDRNDPRDYGLADRFNVLWFTARVDNDDPCVKFGGSLQRPRSP
jgi:uncharacterized iron-regulated protein